MKVKIFILLLIGTIVLSNIASASLGSIFDSLPKLQRNTNMPSDFNINYFNVTGNLSWTESRANTLYSQIKWGYNMTSTSSGGDNATFNQTLTNTLYSSIIWGYNMTSASSGGDNSSWNETRANLLYSAIQWGYNHTQASNLTIVNVYGKYFYNMSDGTGTGNLSFNETRTNLLYSVIIWGYNQTYTGGTYNSTYAIWAYNQTSSSVGGGFYSDQQLNKTSNVTFDRIYLYGQNADYDQLMFKNSSNYTMLGFSAEPTGNYIFGGLIWPNGGDYISLDLIEPYTNNGQIGLVGTPFDRAYITNINTTNICLGGVCNTAWPSGGDNETFNQTLTDSLYSSIIWGYNMTSTSSSQWVQNNSDIYYDKGKVSIGSSDTSATQLYVNDNSTTHVGYIDSPWFTIGQYQNYLLYNERFENGVWRKYGGIPTITADLAISPIDSLIAENISGGTTGSAAVYQNITNATLGTWAWSVYLRNLSGTGIIGLKMNSSGEDMTTKNITLTNEWRRYAITNNFTVAHANKSVFIIVGTNHVQVFGAQFEPNSFARVYSGPLTSAPATALTSAFYLRTGTPTFNSGLYMTGSLTGATSGAFTDTLTDTIQGLFISRDGIIQTSTTASTVSAPINRPARLRMTGTVWDLGSSASRSTNWIIENFPRVGETGTNSSATLDFDYGYNGVTDTDLIPIMSLDSNGSLDVFGTYRASDSLSNWNFTGNTNWSYNGGWIINTTSNKSRFEFSRGATGNLTQNLTQFKIQVKPNKYYELTYNLSGTGVAGCLAYIPTTFANKRIYLPGVSLTTSATYDINFKTNSNPQNFSINAVCTAGSFYMDDLRLREIDSGDIIANGKFTGGGLEGIKIDSLGNVNVTAGNVTINQLISLKSYGTTLPTPINGSITRNNSGFYSSCDGATWTKGIC